MTKTRQIVRVNVPGMKQMPIVRADIQNVRKVGRQYIGEYRTMSGETQRVWRRISGEEWRPLK